MKNKKHNYIKIIGLITLICVIFAQSDFLDFKNISIKSNNTTDTTIPIKPIGATSSATIFIDGDTELANFINGRGLSGEGTYTSPYIIENYFIAAISGTGIYIKNTNAYLIIRNCTIFNGISYENDGIYLQRTSNVKITNNTMINNRWGIFLRYSPNNIISNNFVNNSYSFGITLYSESDNCTISDNNVSNCNWGITITDSDNSIISGNNLTYNGDAVFLNNYCNDCTISGNDITDNSLGVFLFADCSDNIIFGNNIRYNYRGIEIDDDCNYNLIYFNDVYENVKSQAEEFHESLGNQWDNGTVGNYWGDYEEKYPNARNNSVFWKTPYEIDGNDLGVDNFPLVNPILEYEPLEKTTISGFPLVNMLIFISIGVYLLGRRIISQRLRR
jgi:parallel beta-helix repeat protein